jgi:excisionase family DNA binding protein
MCTLPAASASVGWPLPFPVVILPLPPPSVPPEVQSSGRFAMTPIRDLSGTLAPALSARDSNCLARENGTAAVLRSGAQTRGRAMPNDNGGSEKLLTKGEVAQLCRVEVRTVDRWLIAGKIRCYRTPSGRVLFRRNDVLTAIDREHFRA